jgi:hypothetical protein
MPDRIFIARLFLISGLVLAVVGVVLGFTLPIPSMFPPFLITALLALAYGLAWRWPARSPVMKP